MKDVVEHLFGEKESIRYWSALWMRFGSGWRFRGSKGRDVEVLDWMSFAIPVPARPLGFTERREG